MKASGISLIVASLGMAGIVYGQNIDTAGSGPSATARRHGFYVGIGGGPTEVSTAGNSRQVGGIDYRFTADESDLGSLFYAGYWISDNVGFELGTRDYGTVNVDMEFSDPHDNTSGTGESEVSVDGFSVSLMLGYDILDEVLQVYARAGMLMWDEKFESRFDIPGQPAVYREITDDGTGALYGIGLAWRFRSTWSLQLQYEMAELDEDDISMASMSLSYDFIGWLREPNSRPREKLITDRQTVAIPYRPTGN